MTKKQVKATMVDFYCPACGESGTVEFLGLLPGANQYTCPNCDTVFDVSMDFYEVEAVELETDTD